MLIDDKKSYRFTAEIALSSFLPRVINVTSGIGGAASN